MQFFFSANFHYCSIVRVFSVLKRTKHIENNKKEGARAVLPLLPLPQAPSQSSYLQGFFVSQLYGWWCRFTTRAAVSRSASHIALQWALCSMVMILIGIELHSLPCHPPSMPPGAIVLLLMIQMHAVDAGWCNDFVALDVREQFVCVHWHGLCLVCACAHGSTRALLLARSLPL